MDLLLDLPLTRFDDFEIAVSKIAAGWMDINVSFNGGDINYRASYLTDPLNDLLAAAVSFVNYKEPVVHYKHVPDPPKYFHAVHALEPGQITWLLKWLNNDLILAIWENVAVEIEDLIDSDFNKALYEHQISEDVPDLTEGLLFAAKDSPVPFIKALTKTFHSLQELTRFDRQDDWGFKYSLDHLNILETWLANHDI